MTILSMENRNKWDLARMGKIGSPVGLPYWLSWSIVGDNRWQNGRYQLRKGKNGLMTVQYRHFWNRDNPTTTQLAIRATFRDGVAEWHSLTPTQKKVYNDMRYPYGQSGFTRHMTEYLKAHL